MDTNDRPYQRFNSSLDLGLCFFLWVVVFPLALATSGCASLRPSAPADARKRDYVAAHRDLSPEIARAIDAGRLVLGMSPEQVGAAIGQPDRKTRFEATGSEVWLYRASRVHVNQSPDGVEAFRLVFVKERLAFIEPF